MINYSAFPKVVAFFARKTPRFQELWRILKIRLFQKWHISKIFQRWPISKIGLFKNESFSKNRPISKIDLFQKLTYFKN